MTDPWVCRICGLPFTSASYGGPGICPSCDCGNFGATVVQRQAKAIERLRSALEQCNEHRDSPYKIIGIVDEALFDSHTVEPAAASKCQHDLLLDGCTIETRRDLVKGYSLARCIECGQGWTNECVDVRAVEPSEPL